MFDESYRTEWNVHAHKTIRRKAFVEEARKILDYKAEIWTDAKKT